jgi:choline dehydrogenase
VLFDGTAAAGAEVVSSAGTEVVEADRVWLCAGAIGTPTLLLRSGVGPAADLAALGIQCVLDRPGVGQGLIDHPNVILAARTRPDLQHDPMVIMELGARYSSGHPAGTFNDMQLAPCIVRGVPGWPDVLTMLVGVYDPRSVGAVTLNPGDPWAAPIVNPQHLADPADLERAVDGARRAWQVIHADPLVDAIEGGCLGLTPDMVDDDVAMATFVRGACQSFHHPVGTARMGQPDDAAAVVDGCCRLYGATRLHVVDASVMPTIPRANTNFPTMMLAEHAVELSVGLT